ncbi:MAG TPA: M20/M25/M40 family metallo-hydrolase [Pirellulales bacterium]|jgi:tripeptide aminopeptidase|nr:M20/M25/M40 family metallo-hydrolase [Pirellulales bacterium]
MLDPLELVLQLMAIPGVSGQEGAVAEFITEHLRKAGAPPAAIRTDRANRRTPVASPTGNIVLRLPGTVRRPRRLLLAHMDTVPICVGSRPEIHDGFVRSADPATGLGADDRSGVAVILSAAMAVLREKPAHPPLTFFWTIQEETGLHGARHADLALLGSPKLAFNFDGGTPERMTIGATGGYRMTIDITGLASHAGVAPQMGISAIAIAGLAIADLQQNGWHGEVRKGKQRGTSNIGLIEGGAATNVVTNHVRLKAEARSHDPAFRGRIIRAFETAFRRAAKQVCNADGKRGDVAIDGRLDYEAFRLADDDASVLAAEEAARALGLAPVRSVSNGGLDANWLSARGIPTVTLGCGQIGPHTPAERLDIAAFRTACQVALRLATVSEN